MNNTIKTSRFWILAIFAAMFPLFILIFRPGMWVTDDGDWMIIRLSAFAQELRNGQFPVRWLGRLNHEYGYPVANFLYPGFLYVGSLIHFIGFGIVSSVKLLFAGSIVFLGYGLFLWLRKIFSDPAAGVGAITGIYAPYFLFDLFQRGSVGEVLALSIVPFFLYSVVSKRIVLASLAYGMIILMHNTMAVLFTPILIIYAWLNNKFFLISIFFGLGLSAFFWIPAMLEQAYVIFPRVRVSDWQRYFLNFDTLFLIGLIGLMVLGFTIILLQQKRIRSDRIFLLMLFSLLSAFLAASPLTTVVWSYAFLPRLFQFPWRFLAVTIISFSYIVAYFISLKKDKHIQSAFVTVSIFVVIIAISRYQKIKYQYNTDTFYETNDATTTVQDEYLPVGINHPPQNRPASKIESLSGYSKISINRLKSSAMDFNVDAGIDDTIDINTLYYPGWSLLLNNKNARSSMFTDNGYIKISIPSGKTNVKVFFSETPMRLAADSVSFLSLLILLAIGQMINIRKTRP